MPEIPINVLQSVVAVEQLCNEVAKLQKQLRYLVNGQIDFENVRARSIKAQNIETETLTANEIAANAITAIKIAAEAVTAAKIAAEAVEASKIKAGAVETDKLAAGAVTADKITVAELSAIAADLGHITAGLIEAVTIIGSEIMTQDIGVYPRSELSSLINLFLAESAAGTGVYVAASLAGGAPAIYHSYAGVVKAILDLVSSGSAYSISTLGTTDISLQAAGNAILDSAGNTTVKASNDVKINCGRYFEVNGLRGWTGTFQNLAGETVRVENGIIYAVTP